jgi:hypothetical protein
MENKITVQIQVAGGKTLGEKLEVVDKIINHIKKEHGDYHTLSFEVLFEGV